MAADTDIYKACYWYLRCIKDIASQNIDKKFQLNAFESLIIVTTCLLQDFTQNITLRTIVYSVSVIVCCYVRYMLKHVFWKVKRTF